MITFNELELICIEPKDFLTKIIHVFFSVSIYIVQFFILICTIESVFSSIFFKTIFNSNEINYLPLKAFVKVIPK